MISPFALIPVEVFMDDRLTKIELRVLGAILSFRNRDTNLSRPTREQIGERCGYNDRTISKATTSLVGKGWLRKAGKGGAGVATAYQFVVPDLQKTVSDADTVTNGQTVSEPGTVPESGTVPDPGTKPCPVRAQNPVRTGDTNRPVLPFRPKREARGAFTLPPEVDPQVWSDFDEHRRSEPKLRKGWSSVGKRRTAALLARYTPAEQRHLVDYSISGGYSGLFPDQLTRQSNNQPRKGNVARAIEVLGYDSETDTAGGAGNGAGAGSPPRLLPGDQRPWWERQRDGG